MGPTGIHGAAMMSTLETGRIEETRSVRHGVRPQLPQYLVSCSALTTYTELHRILIGPAQSGARPYRNICGKYVWTLS